MTLSQQWVEQTLERMSAEHHWHWTTDSYHHCIQQVHKYAVQSNIKSHADLGHLIFNYYSDQTTVQIALNHDHPEYQDVWATIHVEINNWLHQKRFYPQDATMLNEFSPDVCAFEILRVKLKNFRYKCRLKSYIHRVTERCTHEWLRSHAALKRGGCGVLSATQRRSNPTVHNTRKWRMCYLSQSLTVDPTLIWEEIIPSAERSPAEIVEMRLLVAEIERVVHGMTSDPHYTLVRQVWRELLFEQANVTALAQRWGIPSRTLFNVKSRIVRRVMPIVQRWHIS